MKTETLKRAKELEELLKSYNSHLIEIKRIIDEHDRNEGRPLFINNCLSSNGRNPSIYEEFLPLSPKDFLTFYRMKIEAKIDLLTKELEAL